MTEFFFYIVIPKKGSRQDIAIYRSGNVPSHVETISVDRANYYGSISEVRRHLSERFGYEMKDEYKFADSVDVAVFELGATPY